jgi:predicted PurR-regulated permease PerM
VGLKDYPKVVRFFFLFGSFLLIVTFLYWAKPIVVPLAVAVLLTFVLAPAVAFVQRSGMGRLPAVLLVVVLVFLLLGGIGAVFVNQMQELALELPSYKTQIEGKIAGLRQLGTESTLNRFADFLSSVGSQLGLTPNPNASANTAPMPVTVESGMLPMVQSVASPLLEFLINAVLIFILVIFMLVRREDLRNRLIRLWGHHNLTSTTRVLDDASQRISRFLFSQLILNSAFGVVLALGLMLIGIPYAYIWGFMAAILRYVPYVGPWLAAVFPLLVSLVMPGWTAFFLVLGYFIVLELVHGNAVEPLVFGHSIGVSGIALLVAAMFWTWMWGPLGLVLSTPLTALLYVFGRHVPSLEFLTLVLGDEPVMTQSASYYQRLLAKDADEAERLVEDYLKDHTADQVYQDIFFPTLLRAKRDRDGEAVTEDDQAFILEATRDIFHDLVLPAEIQPIGADGKPSPHMEVLAPRKVVLGLPTQDRTDALALEMFKEALNPDLFQYVSASASFHEKEKLGDISDDPHSLFMVLTLSGKNMVRTRVLCRKIRALYPHAKVYVGCWGLEEDANVVRDKLADAGVDGVGVTFAETRELLNSAA